MLLNIAKTFLNIVKQNQIYSYIELIDLNLKDLQILFHNSIHSAIFIVSIEFSINNHDNSSLF